MTNYAEILDKLNYPYQDLGNYIKSIALYRGGNSMGSLVIYKSGSGGSNEGKVVDFVTGQIFSFEDFIKLASGDDNIKVEELLSKVVKIEKKEPKITTPQVFDSSILNTLIPDHSYWLNRGISLNTLLKFKGGVMLEGKLKNRYVFPIFNQKMDVVGFCARDLTGKSLSKYKLIGSKKDWVHPAFLNSKVIQDKKEVILVEGVGCALSLMECGIENSLVLFGTHLGLGIINYLMKVNPTRIIIATNNDSHNVGQAAAVTISRVLARYFSKRSIFIDFPPKKDFNVSLELEGGKQEIEKWYENCKNR